MEDTDHVLIVDDDRGIRELLATYLEKNGMRVSLAANGRQMRTALELGAPDLIVLDLMMPGEDGLVLCRELRAGKFRSVPVLMLTARSEEADRIVGLELMRDAIAGPVDGAVDMFALPRLGDGADHVPGPGVGHLDRRVELDGRRGGLLRLRAAAHQAEE